MKFKCPVCDREVEMTWQENTKKLIEILYQWKGHLTIDQVIEKQKEILRDDEEK